MRCVRVARCGTFDCTYSFAAQSNVDVAHLRQLCRVPAADGLPPHSTIVMQHMVCHSGREEPFPVRISSFCRQNSPVSLRLHLTAGDADDDDDDTVHVSARLEPPSQAANAEIAAALRKGR